MRNERNYIKNVGYRIIRNIQLVKSGKSVDVFEGYYLRQSRTMLEEGYQKVLVCCVTDRKLDDRWFVIEDET
jgi:hypothetical protein